ncbi:MAG: helix-turn-helix domain-containing protein [Clostridia bacterium]|nr:helix-turn-helix domain-containing protein [Clostridia bacterium]
MTCSQLRCLIELKRLSEKNPDVPSISLTRQLKLSKPSVHRLLEGLINEGYVEKEYYGAAHLTKEGMEAADEIARKADMLAKRLSGGIVSQDSAYMAALVLLSGIGSDSFTCFKSQMGVHTK